MIASVFIPHVSGQYEQGVCHIVALPITLKKSEGKRRIMKLQIFHHGKI
jgi:hypothetical protein